MKTLVEHGERDNISFNSVSSACAVDKLRLMGERCAEKTHRSSSVLLKVRRKPAAASFLQQAETGCAMEQELFQSQHASILEHGVTAQQSFSSSHETSMQVNTIQRRARMPEDVVATVRPRLEMCAMTSVLCKRNDSEIDWEKLVKAERKSEVKRMLEIELYEEVNEELTSAKRLWNSACLDPQEKLGVTRSAPAENQISGACQCRDVFAGKRKSMRKDETTRKLLKTMYGIQVAGLRWQRLGRGTLCEDRRTVLTSVPCGEHNETEDSLVVFHGAITPRLSTIACVETTGQRNGR